MQACPERCQGKIAGHVISGYATSENYTVDSHLNFFCSLNHFFRRPFQNSCKKPKKRPDLPTLQRNPTQSMVDQSTDRERSSFNECGIDCMGVMVKPRQLRLKLTAFPSLMARLWSLSWAGAILSPQTKLFAPFQSDMPYRFLPVTFRHHSITISNMITVMDPVLEVRTSLMTSIGVSLFVFLRRPTK